jgi:hypothetical protein
MADSQRLQQRNKNVLLDLSKKQQTEYKRTLEFLKYALGNRTSLPSVQTTINNTTVMDYSVLEGKLDSMRVTNNDVS